MFRFLLSTVFALFLTPVTGPGDPNACDRPGERPDVIVGDLPGVANYGNLGDIFAYAIGTTSCNVGTCQLKWHAWTNEHPVIAQNMYKLQDGRLTQVGQSWLKHGFAALSLDLCSDACVPTNGTTLGVNCSDPYWAALNGSQGGLGPRWQVNAATGEFPYPFAPGNGTVNNIYKRLQVHRDDLDPNLNAGALYFVEGHYITQDDAVGRAKNNNASWREVVVSPTQFNLSLVGPTMRESPAIDVWKLHHPDVIQDNVDVQQDGRIITAGRTLELPAGGRRYEYAIQNLNSDRSVRRFDVPVPAGATVTNIGFHDIDYHSGEIWDSADWDAYHDETAGKVVWETATYAENPLANALRWGTLYSFWFDVDTAETIVGRASIDLFKPPARPSPPGNHFAYLPTPEPCNFNGVCEAAETCVNCALDCPATMPPCDDDVHDPPERLIPGAIQLDWHGDLPAGESSSRDRVGTRNRKR